MITPHWCRPPDGRILPFSLVPHPHHPLTSRVPDVCRFETENLHQMMSFELIDSQGLITSNSFFNLRGNFRYPHSWEDWVGILLIDTENSGLPIYSKVDSLFWRSILYDSESLKGSSQASWSFPAPRVSNIHVLPELFEKGLVWKYCQCISLSRCHWLIHLWMASARSKCLAFRARLHLQCLLRMLRHCSKLLKSSRTGEVLWVDNVSDIFLPEAWKIIRSGQLKGDRYPSGLPLFYQLLKPHHGTRAGDYQSTLTILTSPAVSGKVLVGGYIATLCCLAFVTIDTHHGE